MATRPRAIIIIPTYNEKGNIGRLLPTLMEVFSSITQWDMHVLVVDDTSPDGTGEVVSEFAKKHKQVHLFTNEKKQGLGHAYLVGMTHAFDTLDADVVFEMDADFSHDPTLIPQFLASLDAGADMVLGSRYIKGGSIPSNWGLYRQFLSVVGNIIIMTILTDFRIRDWTTGYRAIRRSVFEAVRSEMTSERFSGYTFQIGFLHKTVRKGFVVKEVPLKFIDRTEGKSKLGPEYIKNTLLYIIHARIRELATGRFMKFAAVGGLGFLINSSLLFLLFRVPAVQQAAATLSAIPGLGFINTAGLASSIGAEVAIVSNFTWNNLWTFSDRRPTTVLSTVSKFIQFNVSSFGAVAVQLIVVSLGTGLTGVSTLSKLFWLICATGIGMILNFIVYSKIIWKKN